MSRSARLDELCAIQSGGTPRRGHAEFYGGHIPWAKISDLNSDDGMVSVTEESITPEGLESIGGRLVPAGTVLLAMYGSVGKTAVTAVPMSLNQAILGIQVEAPELLDKGYLLRWLQSIQEQLLLSANGVTQQNISATAVRALRIPLAPIAQQRRIAVLLDRADAVRRKREESRRLVDELLRSVFLEMFGDPVRNEKGWPVQRISDASERVQIGPFGSLLHESDYVSGGVPLVNPMHIRNGEIVADAKYSVAPTKMIGLSSYQLQEKDVVMGRRGEMGRCAVVKRTEAGYLCGTGSLLVRPRQDVLMSEYLAHFLSSASVRRLLEQATQGATMPNLNRGIVAALEVPLPPVHLQQRFSELAASVIPALRQRLADSIRSAESIASAIQASIAIGSQGS